jgi:hypothetical protein
MVLRVGVGVDVNNVCVGVVVSNTPDSPVQAVINSTIKRIIKTFSGVRILLSNLLFWNNITIETIY